jgi:hypothetical protein
MYSRLNQVLS